MKFSPVKNCIFVLKAPPAMKWIVASFILGISAGISSGEVKMTLEEISKDLGNQKAKLVDLQEGKKQEQKTELQETKNKLKDENASLSEEAEKQKLKLHGQKSEKNWQRAELDKQKTGKMNPDIAGLITNETRKTIQVVTSRGNSLMDVRLDTLESEFKTCQAMLIAMDCSQKGDLQDQLDIWRCRAERRTDQISCEEGKMTMEENDHQKTEIVRLREEKKKRKVVLQETKNKLKAENLRLHDEAEKQKDKLHEQKSEKNQLRAELDKKTEKMTHDIAGLITKEARKTCLKEISSRSFFPVSFKQGEAGATSIHGDNETSIHGDNETSIHGDNENWRFGPAMAFKRQIFKSLNDRTSPWLSKKGPPQTVYFRFPKALIVTKFSFRSRAENVTIYKELLLTQSPTAFKFVGSNDCNNWKTIMTASADWSTFDQEKEWIIPEEAQTAFICFGITILQNGDRLNQVAIQDLKMWKTIDPLLMDGRLDTLESEFKMCKAMLMTMDCRLKGDLEDQLNLWRCSLGKATEQISYYGPDGHQIGQSGASSSFWSHSSRYAFLYYNKFFSTYWSSKDYSMPATIWYDFTRPVYPVSFSFSSANTGNLKYPTAFDFVGSNDCSSWKVLKRVEYSGFTANKQTRSWQVPCSARKAYSCYGIRATRLRLHESNVALTHVKMFTYVV